MQPSHVGMMDANSWAVRSVPADEVLGIPARLIIMDNGAWIRRSANG
jgi:hypothetical protein